MMMIWWWRWLMMMMMMNILEKNCANHTVLRIDLLKVCIVVKTELTLLGGLATDRAVWPKQAPVESTVLSDYIFLCSSFLKIPDYFFASLMLLIIVASPSEHEPQTPAYASTQYSKKFLQAYIFLGWKDSAHNHNQNEFIEICTVTHRRDSCMKGFGKC